MVHQYQQTPTSSVKKEEQEKAYLPSIYENKATVKPEKHLQEVEIEDAQEYEENSFSVNEMEKNLIKKALDKHSGKRKLAALDLKISERTLYRKIKEYDLDA